MTEIQLMKIIDRLPDENPYQRMLTSVVGQFPQIRVSNVVVEMIQKGVVDKGRLHQILTANQGAGKNHASGQTDETLKKYHTGKRGRRGRLS